MKQHYCREVQLARAPLADLITPGGPGYGEAPQSLGQRC